MAKISEETTLGQLEIERMKLGVTAVLTEILPERAIAIKARVFTANDFAIGIGSSLAQALEHAFEQLRGRLARELAALRPRTRSGPRPLVPAPEPEPVRPYEWPHSLTPPEDLVERQDIARRQADGRMAPKARRCEVPLCGESGLCDECRRNGAG